MLLDASTGVRPRECASALPACCQFPPSVRVCESTCPVHHRRIVLLSISTDTQHAAMSLLTLVRAWLSARFSVLVITWTDYTQSSTPISTQHSEHITPLLCNLHSLHSPEQIKFCLYVLAYCFLCICQIHTRYLVGLTNIDTILKPMSTPRGTLSCFFVL